MTEAEDPPPEFVPFIEELDSPDLTVEQAHDIADRWIALSCGTMPPERLASLDKERAELGLNGSFLDEVRALMRQSFESLVADPRWPLPRQDGQSE